ncbi:hypothetical protein OROHE_023406 [Orobanche hederae]
MANKTTNLLFFILVITSLMMLAKSDLGLERINFGRLLRYSDSVKPMDRNHPSSSPPPPPPPQHEFQLTGYALRPPITSCVPPDYVDC